MNQMCDVVRDLLGMYAEGECLEGTKAFVEAHLAECEECRAYLVRWYAVEMPEAAPPTSQEEQAVRRSFRKVKRRWAVSLMAALMMIPLLGLG